MTVSIVGRCARTGMLGVAITSSSPAVAARCAHARADVGAVATQNVTDPRLGPAGLDALADGATAAEAIAILRERAGAAAPYRQLAIVDRRGGAEAFSGAHCLGAHAQTTARDVAAAGNLLANPEIPARMVQAFTADPRLHLADRLLSALDVALAAGGEVGPVRSAGLLLMEGQSWPVADLRVDWGERPVGDLKELWTLWRPQMSDYLVRALDPARGPAFGVPGEA